MLRRRLIWNVAPVYLAVIVLSTVAVAWYAGDVVKTVYYERVEQELENKTNLLAGLIASEVHGDRRELQALCQRLGREGGIRVTVMLPDGVVIGDSDDKPEAMDNHATRPEMLDALAGKSGRVNRYSNTLQAQMRNLARPILVEGRIIAVVRAGIPLLDLQSTLRRVYLRVFIGGFLVIVISAGMALLMFQRHVVAPLKALEQGARRFASGDFSEPISQIGSREFTALTQGLNAMAMQLDEKIRTITQQAHEQQAVLAGMIEGVIAVDAQEKVIMLNAAAARWLDVDMTHAYGRAGYEVIRHIKLKELIAQALETRSPVEGELSLRGDENRLSLAAQASPLRGAEGGELSGVVVVLHDVTRLRHLETVRQQFVSNVSHELKTPIAAIKAAVETLMDEHQEMLASQTERESNEPGVEPDVSSRFLSIIARQADRLNAIVEDLLMLARIEEEEQDRRLVLGKGPLLPVLRGAVETCQANADDKGMTVQVQVDESLEAKMNAPLLEQAVVNLLDNAIKYSPAGTTVQIRIKRENGEIVIAVRDHGPGIEKMHLSRVFERFYRTDKARSRALGGTGLGLAIVKHVAQAHGGRVSVDSSQEEGPARGSTFRIHLPGNPSFA